MFPKLRWHPNVLSKRRMGTTRCSKWIAFFSTGTPRFWIGFLVFVLVFASSTHLFSRTGLASLLRANRWNEIEKRFQGHSPKQDRERYAVALAILKAREPANKDPESRQKIIDAFQYLITTLDITCTKANNEKQLLACLRDIPLESYKDPFHCLAAWKGSIQAERFGFHELSKKLASLINLRKRDPLSKKVFQQRLGQLIRGQFYMEAMTLANRKDLKHFHSPFSNFLRARTMAYNKKLKRATKMYFHIGQITSAQWLRSSILKDLKYFNIAPFDKGKLSTRYYTANRKLVAFSDVLEKSELNKLRKVISPRRILKSTNKRRLRSDGIYLIKSGSSKKLLQLNKKFTSYLSLARNAKIIGEWITQLRANEQDKVALRLLTSYKSRLYRSPSLRLHYLELLGKKYDDKGKTPNKKYFQKVLSYIKAYPYSGRAYDLLLKNLTGSTEKINWAPASFWQLAESSIRPHPASGRFFYWLQRYYASQNESTKQWYIARNFYHLAPGSFYSSTFWKKKGYRRSMKRDWKKVKNRKGYLIWVAKYGGNKQAINFLKGKSIQSYWDKQAVKIWEELRDTPVPKDKTVRLLFSLGEWRMGTEFFQKTYGHRLSRKQYLLQLTQLGRFSQTWNVQVYYLRQLLQRYQIPLDAFSLPTKLAKLLYPRPYRQMVIRYAKRYGIEEDMVYALMHQESLFRENAVSPSGAQGLMQIMPSTGEWLAANVLKTKTFDLQDPKTNIKLGTNYFSQLMQKYKGDFLWAAIAYNGGPGNVRNWKKTYYHNDDFYHFLEKIPSREARNYCRITYENYLRYRILYDLTS